MRSGKIIAVRGHTTDLVMRIERLEIDHVRVASAARGERIAMQVPARVRTGDIVYRLLPANESPET